MTTRDSRLPRGGSGLVPSTHGTPVGLNQRSRRPASPNPLPTVRAATYRRLWLPAEGRRVPQNAQSYPEGHAPGSAGLQRGFRPSPNIGPERAPGSRPSRDRGWSVSAARRPPKGVILRVVELPTTQYATTCDGVHIAYQVFGEGPVDLLYCGVHWWHLEFQWTEPHWRRFLDRLGGFGRVLLFDKRGTGLSDRVPTNELPTLEQRVDDLVTVLDAVASSSAVAYGGTYGAQLAIALAAMFPERVDALVIEDAMARLMRADDYPWGITQEQADRTLDRMNNHWGSQVNLQLSAPSRANDPEAIEWWTTMQRLAASPGAAVTIMRTAMSTDVRSLLPGVRCPTLVIHRADNRLIEVGHGRYLAKHLPDARYVELPGADVFFIPRDNVADLIEEFVTGRPAPVRTDRKLAAVLFTDIVDSTAEAARLGDTTWRELLDRHDALVDRALQRHRGDKVKTTGDGVLATFDGPSQAVQCAAAICDEMPALGLHARAGVHVGEIELRGTDIGGISVHTAARVASKARVDEVVVTRTVVDLCSGAGLEFESLGTHELKGVPAMFELFALRR